MESEKNKHLSAAEFERSMTHWFISQQNVAWAYKAQLQNRSIDISHKEIHLPAHFDRLDRTNMAFNVFITQQCLCDDVCRATELIIYWSPTKITITIWVFMNNNITTKSVSLLCIKEQYRHLKCIFFLCMLFGAWVFW